MHKRILILQSTKQTDPCHSIPSIHVVLSLNSRPLEDDTATVYREMKNDVELTQCGD